MKDESKTIDPSRGRILIVDDDPIVAGMLGISLNKFGFETIASNSGEDCLERFEKIQPDTLFLDIEMPGIDGYETCRQLRARPDTKGLVIIFLSARDTLDSRLAAFDAGGDDFVAKPFIAEEVCRKANVAVKYKAEQKKLAVEKDVSDRGIQLVLSGLEEANNMLKFTRSALCCHTLQGLARLAVESLKNCSLTSHVQIRSQFGTLTMTPEGIASPLEASVIELSRKQGRIFQFKRRMIVNYDSFSILVTDMPIDDPDAVGRIRDYVAMICESGEHALDNIVLRLEANVRADELRQLVEATRAALSKFHSVHRALQSDTRCGLDQMVNALEGMVTSLGLLDSQESTISRIIRSAVTDVLDLLDQGATADEDFRVVLSNLAIASETRITGNKEASLSTDVQLF
jgi:DNA-binding response OmpR family regulator